MGISILGMGRYVPDQILTNDDFTRFVETNDEWIRTRTGITERPMAGWEPTWYMGKMASLRAIEAAGVSAEDIGLVISCTVTSDFLTPSMASVIQHEVGASEAAAFDLNAACSGFVYALDTARRFLETDDSLKYVLVVANEAHRRFSEAVWNLPEGYLEDIKTPGYHTTKIFREMSNGGIDFLWTAHNNWAQSMTNLTRFLGRGAEDKRGIFDTFIVVSEVYPTISTKYANVVLPAAMWVEREGQFGNGERRTAVFEKAVDPPGDAMWDMWILMEIAKRVLADEKIGDEDAFEALFGQWYDKDKADFKFDTQREVCKSMWEEYRTFSNPSLNPRAAAINAEKNLKMEGKQLAPYEEYIYNHGMTWPVREVNGKWLPTKWRFSYGPQEEGFDQVGIEMYGDLGLASDVSFYKSADHKPSVVFRPWEPPAETPDADYPFVFCTGRLLEHWHTGSMTRRVPALDNALPEALLDMNPDDMDELGIKDGDRVKVVSRWGEFEVTASSAGRTQPPRKYLFVPFFAEETLVNLAQQEMYCPLSKEPDYKKTCVRVEKL